MSGTQSNPGDAQDSVGQAEAPATPCPINSDPRKGTTTKSFHRTFVHYITSNRDARGLYTVAADPSLGTKKTAIWDEGWQRIPYESLMCSVNPRDWLSFGANHSAFKIDSVGFSLSGYTPLVEQISAVNGSSTITSQFITAPMLQTMKDDSLWTQDLVKPVNAGEAWTSCNDSMTTAYPQTQADGTLIRAEWDMGPDFVSALGGEIITAWGSLNTLNDHSTGTVSPGGGFSHTAPCQGHWYPLGNPAGMTKDNAVGNYPPHFYVTDLATEKSIGNIEANMVTMVNANNLASPTPYYVRIFPYNGASGPIQVVGQVMVTYHSTLTFQNYPSSGWLPLHQKALTATGPYKIARPSYFSGSRVQNLYENGVGYSYKKEGKSCRSIL